MVTLSDLFKQTKERGKPKKSPSKKRQLKSLSKELHEKLLKEQQERLKSFKTKMDSKRNLTDKAADFLTESFGTIWFLGLNTVWFGVWVVLNTGLIPGIQIFDPFPFGLLTMIVSLEAIFLAIIVLISQNRAAHVADLREEIDLHINVKAEHEITKMIIMLDAIHDHLGLPPEDDEELVMMKQRTNLNEIEDSIISEMKKK